MEPSNSNIDLALSGEQRSALETKISYDQGCIFDGFSLETDSQAVGSFLSLEKEIQEPGFVIVQNELVEMRAESETKETVFDLSEVFPAADLLSQMGLLRLEVTDNSAPAVILAEIAQDQLTIRYIDEISSEVSLTVIGTYLDGKVYHTPFIVLPVEIQSQEEFSGSCRCHKIPSLSSALPA